MNKCKLDDETRKDELLKLWDEELKDFQVDIRKEHKECKNKNFNGFCVESKKLAGCASYIDVILEQVAILRKMSFGEDILKEMSYGVRKGINSTMMYNICDNIISETNKFKNYLNQNSDVKKYVEIKPELEIKKENKEHTSELVFYCDGVKMDGALILNHDNSPEALERIKETAWAMDKCMAFYGSYTVNLIQEVIYNKHLGKISK